MAKSDGRNITLNFHLDGTPFPIHTRTFPLPPQSSQQSAWSSILAAAGDCLGLSDVEGIYTSIGGYPVHRVASLRNGATYAVRPTEDCAMSKSLLPLSTKEKAQGYNPTFPAWESVEEGRQAKIKLEEMEREFREMGGGEFLEDGSEKEHVHLGGVDIGKSHQSSWRVRLVKRGKRNWRRKKEGLPPIYNTDSEGSDEGSSCEGRGSDDGSDDGYERGNPVFNSTAEGFYDEYKRMQVEVDDERWIERYGKAGEPLKRNLNDFAVVDETGRILDDCLSMLRGEGGRHTATAGEILEAMEDGMRIGREKQKSEGEHKSKCKRVEKSGAGGGAYCGAIDFPGGKTVKKLGQRLEDVRKDNFGSLDHPQGSTVGLGGSYDGISGGDFGPYSSVAIYGLRALASVTKLDIKQCEEFMSHKGHRLVLKAMMDHKDNRHVGMFGSLCMANVASGKSGKANATTLAKAGAVKEICRRLEVNKAQDDVCWGALMALWKLAEAGIYDICEQIVKHGGVKNAVKAGKRHLDNIKVHQYSVWMMRELARCGMEYECRMDEGLFLCGFVSRRYYDNEYIAEAAAELEQLLMTGVDTETEEGRWWRREMEEGRATGGGSVDDHEVVRLLNKFPRGDRMGVFGGGAK
ncbi:hypothetical protein TrCOL_g11286 [Triparma columacea]|uniref:Uncharacterized protein n=1 Tax=Triparma columacea TaxID=722753 RepID=A0A9W7FXU6_9STRA|nr:hypothetical protein TrCOL_g11286 [Triparma columacea]